MSLLIAGLFIFIAIHSVSIVAPEWRGRIVNRLGDGPWKGAYSLLAIIGFVLIVVGYGAARSNPMTSIVLYTPPVWTRHLALVLMLPVFPLLLAAYLPGRIKSAARHPLLLATKIWALAHLLANGMLADVLLFGVILAWAVADRISLKHRPAHAVPAAPPGRANDAIALVGGIVIYAAFVAYLHKWLFGVSPLH